MGLTSSSVAEEDLRDELETNERPKTQMPSGASTAAPRALSVGSRCSSTRDAPLLLACRRRQVLFLPSSLCSSVPALAGNIFLLPFPALCSPAFPKSPRSGAEKHYSLILFCVSLTHGSLWFHVQGPFDGVFCKVHELHL